MAKDPVCGMEVEEKQAHNQTQYRGKAYHFCTPRCKEFFDRDPERYLRAPEGDLLDTRKVAIVGTGQVGSTFAFALPLAAGVIASYGVLPSPAMGAILMSLSTVIVAINVRFLKIRK